MPPTAATATVFARSHRLRDGLRVRLRLARPGDEGHLADLAARLGFSPSEPALRDLVRFRPHGRSVVCATALVHGQEQVIGFGADSAEGSATVLVEPDHAAELTPLLRRALGARAASRQPQSVRLRPFRISARRARSSASASSGS